MKVPRPAAAAVQPAAPPPVEEDIYGLAEDESQPLPREQITPAPSAPLPSPARQPTAAKAKTDFFAPEKKGIEKGVVGGLLMIGIAVVWFVAGLAAGYIFFYPPILFLIGLFALLKGLFTGNLAGGSGDRRYD